MLTLKKSISYYTKSTTIGKGMDIQDAYIEFLLYTVINNVLSYYNVDGVQKYATRLNYGVYIS